MAFGDITGRWDYGSLPANVKLGAHCFIERKESFSRYRSAQPIGLSLGDNVVVYTWSQFNIEPSGVVVVGADSVLVGAVFMCAARIDIGARVVVSYHVTIADSDFHPLGLRERRRDAVANAPNADSALRPTVESSPVAIEDDVWIGIGAYILKGVHIGRGARVEPGAIVTRNVPAGAVVAGNPARIVRQ